MKPRALSEIPQRFHAEIMGQLGNTLTIGSPTAATNVTFTRYLNWTLPYPPSANAYWRSIVVHGRGRVVVSREAKAFKKAVSAALAGLSPLTGPVHLVANFYRPRKRGDLDNLLKVTCDALKGIAYHDDDQIVKITASRFEDKGRPRVEVSVSLISEA
jgi:crossover junction endodeoxyribonuclease RusA